MEQRTEGIKKQAQELIEQAYQRGFKNGENSRIDECAKALDEAVIAGCDEAWEAVKKLMQMDLIERTKIFSEVGRSTYDVIKDLSASEAIEKIKAYEEKKKQEEDERIEVNKEKVMKLADEIGIHNLFAIVKEIRGE